MSAIKTGEEAHLTKSGSARINRCIFQPKARIGDSVTITDRIEGRDGKVYCDVIHKRSGVDFTLTADDLTL